MAHSTPTEVLHQHDGAHTHHGRRAPVQRRPHIAHLFPDEEVYGFYHSHPIVFIRALPWPFLAAVILMVLTLALGQVNMAGLSDWAVALLSVGHLLFFAALIGIGLWIFYMFQDWRADYLLISDRRILLNLERPLLNKHLREVPVGKIQNVITHHASFNQIGKKLMGVGELVIDTAGLGQIAFHDMSEKQAEHAQSIILDLQKGASAATRVPREQYRHEVVQSMLRGGTPPAQPRRVVVQSYPRMGYDFFNELVPHCPQREGLQVIWHRHWWFLVLAIAKPILLVVLFEVANLAVAIVGNLLGLTDNNPVLSVLAVVRPFLYFIVLPFIAWQWADWRNDRYILNKDQVRIVDTLPFGLRETVKETEVRRVVDASVSVPGPMAKLLGYGAVVIKTPGEATEFTFAEVPRPFEVHREVMTRIEAQREQEQVQWDRDIQEWLRAYIEERRAEPTPQPPPAAEGWGLW